MRKKLTILASTVMLPCVLCRSRAQDPRERPVVEFVSVESVRGTRPANKALVCEWFKTIERPKGVGTDPNGAVCIWFHGQLRSNVGTSEPHFGLSYH